MFIPTVLLLVGAVGVGVWYGFADLAASAAHNFVDVSGYQAAVFGVPRHLAAARSSSPAWYDYLYCVGATLLALTFTAIDLWSRQIGAGARSLLTVARSAIAPVRRLHTGRIGDYTAALALGVGLLAALMTLTLA